jgi:hypothetical protein
VFSQPIEKWFESQSHRQRIERYQTSHALQV